MSLTKQLFQDTEHHRPSLIMDEMLYIAKEKDKSKVTPAFMSIVGIIKKELDYKQWMSKTLDIKKDLKATDESFNKIIKSISTLLKVDCIDKLRECNTPEQFETVVLQHMKKAKR